MQDVDNVDASWNALVRAMGQMLTSSEGTFYVSSGGSISSLLDIDQLRLGFDGGHFRFSCGTDGETLAIDRGDLRVSDLGDYGSMRKGELSTFSEFGRLLNAKLIGVSSVRSLACTLLAERHL
jgi:hypothetical protein